MSIKLKDTSRIVSKKNEWDDKMAQIGNFDFYQPWYNFEISPRNAEKIMFINSEDKDQAIATILLRKNMNCHGSSDVTSTSGNYRPICSRLSNDFHNRKSPESVKVNLNLRASKVVPSFSRINPYIQNQTFRLDGHANICNMNDILKIDLSLEFDSRTMPISQGQTLLSEQQYE